MLAALICPALPAAAGVLSGREFQNLLAGGPEGTTIVFQGGTDKVFYSPSLKNRLRLASELGPEFLKHKILQNTVTEGVFIGATIEAGKWRTISGIAGIAASAGILFTNGTGGWLYDQISKGGPFYLMAGVSFCIMLFGVWLLRRAPRA